MTIYIKFAGEPVFGDQAIAGIIGPRGKAAWVGMAQEDDPDTGEPYIDEASVPAMVAYLRAASESAVADYRDAAALSAAAALADAESASLSEANVAAMVTQPTVAAQLWATSGVVRGLSSLTGAFDGQRGEVAGVDGGSHTDPVTGTEVANAGVYQWDAGDSAWTWISETTPEVLIASRASGQYALGILPFDSSAIEDGSGNRIGLSFAAGQNGDTDVENQDAVLKITDYVGLSKVHAGARIRLSCEFDISAVFRPLITPFVQVKRAGALVNLTANATPSTTQYTIVRNEKVGLIRYVILDFIATGTEEQAIPFLRFSGTNSLGGETITYRDHRFVMASRVDSTLALSAQQLGALVKGAALGGSDAGFARALSPIPVTIDATVAASGADYTDYRDAYTDVGAGTLTERKRITIEPGIYIHDAAEPGDVSYILPRYTDFRGGDAPHRSIIRFFQADDVAPELTATNEPMRNWYTSHHYDYTIDTKNTRYTVHADPGVTSPDQYLYWEGMRVIHYGNQGAVDYQTSLGGSGDPGAVWPLARAFGYGGSSGWVLGHRHCYMQSYKYGFGFHDNIDFEKPNYVSVHDSDIVLTGPDDDNYAYRFGVLGSGIASKLNFNGVTTNGDMQIQFGGWLSVDPDNQPADPSWQFQIRTQNHDPMKVDIIGQMRALKIASASSADGSGIDLTGSTQALLDAWFGDVYSRDGAGGLAGYVWGYNNVNAAAVGSPSVLINSLGRRAGDRTGDPWTLSITPRGGAAVNIVFSTDLTTVNNATILATINAALGGAAVASEYNLIERHRPVFAGEESPRRNNSAVAIPWRAWTAADTSIRKVRLMTASDAPSRSAGSAIGDDIYPAATGRVKHSGVWGGDDLLINGSPTLAYGDLLEIDPAAPGYLIKNNDSIRPVLRCAGPDLFERAA